MPRHFNEPREFGEEGLFDEQERTTDRARVEAGRRQVHAAVGHRSEIEEKHEQMRLERARQTAARNTRLHIDNSYRAAGLEPPEFFGSTPVSLPLLLQLGWTVTEIDGVKTLVKPPAARPAKRGNNDDLGS